ncbi:MAG: DHHA1 domain-containing protein [Candidatus Poseidoniaceae archaeon]|nr:DHHA1 domain-containing protein [Candidatus Poseidoniaceae archaeon]
MNSKESGDMAALMAKLDSWINKHCSNGAVPVLTGMNGDMDTVGSAIALSSSHSNMMACGLHLGRVAKKVCEELSAPFRKIGANHTNWPPSLSGIIIVDAASPSQVGIELPENIPKCIIDHHDTDDWDISDDDIMIKASVSATTEIITQYLSKYSPKSLTTPVRKLLIAGLITDTGRYRHAGKSAFSATVTLLEDEDIDYASLVEFIESQETSPSERGSLLRGLERSKSIDSGSWNIVYTNSGTLEGRLATLLIGTGAEISLVSRNREGVSRLTARASRKATLCGIHLGEIMETISLQIGGDGGGHSGAAGWSGDADRIAAESAFIAHVASINRKE